MAVGLIDAGSEFIEFLAQKDSVSNSLIAIGPALDKAVDYYSDKLGNGKFGELIGDVNDAYGAVAHAAADYGSKPNFERGEAVGNVTFAFALAEVAPAPMRASSVVVKEAQAGAKAEIGAGEKLFMDSGDFVDEVLRPGRPGWGSPQFYELLKRAAAELPKPLKDALVEGKVHIQQAKYTCDLEPAASTSTLGCYQADFSRIVIAEKTVDAMEKVIDNPDLRFTLAHEVAHVIDSLKGKGGLRLSRSEEFWAAFECDFAKIDVTERRSLFPRYTNSKASGAAELFADAVATSLGIESSLSKSVPNLRKYFPESLKWVQEQIKKW